VKHPKLRKFAKRAGAVALGLVALDLIATAATAVLAWGMFQK
jgi:hypothetical protein